MTTRNRRLELIKQGAIALFLLTLLDFKIGITVTLIVILFIVYNYKIKKQIKQKEKRANELKGDQFENYIETLFNKNEFLILEKTEDLMRIENKFHEDDTKPDFLISHLNTGQNFYVECKYRSKLYNNKYNWSSYKQMCRYMRYALEKKIPCFIILGLEGTADNPEKTYCIPIEKLKYPELYPNQYEGYYHSPRDFFSWDGNTLK